MSVLVSICCLAYNHEKYIADALESFLMQKVNFGIEVIIHDDASTDKTADIIRQYQSKYPDIIKPIFQSENQWSQRKSISMQFIWPKASGKYIAICEGDDYWLDPCKLQKQIDYMESHQECTMSFHAAEVVGFDKKHIRVMRSYSENRICSAGDICIGGGSITPTASMVFRKELMKDPPHWYYCASFEDFPLALIVTCHGYAYYIDEVMSAYRTGVAGSWTDRIFDNANFEQNQISLASANIYILNEFNKYTSSKYSHEVQEAIQKEMFIMLDVEKKLKEMKQEKYKEYYKALNPKRKFKLHIYYFFPGIYTLLKKFNIYLINKRRSIH